MTFRIIGGEWKNVPLLSPKGTATRPTASKVRKALFDICQSFIEGARVLDLFAGTGAIGIEALSRGAASATFIERDRIALSGLQANIKKLKVEGRCQIINADASTALKRLKQPYQLIYIDPPYNYEECDAILSLIAGQRLLDPNGALFFEQASDSPAPVAHPLALEKERIYGGTVLRQYHFRG